MSFVFYLFLLSLFLQLLFYIFIFRKAVNYQISNNETTELPPVSVIICAKDEADNLAKNLPFIYQQNFPKFEVVLIDDRSIDNTWEVMDDYRQKYPFKTRIVRVDFTENPRFIANKKYALTLGIKAAKYDRLLFTDADCRPASNHWIHKITSSLKDEKQLVLGIGKYKASTSFLNKLIRFETLQTSMQYISYALSGMPYMGVGRNLAYTKDLFFGNNGFYNHIDVLSGDDDLFVNEVANKENTAICLSTDSFTISSPKKKWKEWIYQKRRHITTASHYKLKHRLLLSFYYLSIILFYFSAFFLLINNYRINIVLGLIILRYIFVIYFQNLWMKKLGEKDLSMYFIFLEPALLIVQFYIFIVNLFHKPKTWSN